VLFCPFETKDEDSIRRAIQHSNIVINLVGRGIETSNFSYEDINVRFPAALARICREMGVKRLVHISSINAR
jgi:NADH dehydrogenase (ubiquinone) 1 alpha subcomplex subunit 9